MQNWLRHIKLKKMLNSHFMKVFSLKNMYITFLNTPH
uniref:Uncharacterized protein n=1 Tax=Anguilla anguilla TaxID=7936 RepID=A0A0E9V097_ANGAN